MARQFDLVVFDWDGTLMDSAAAIVRAIVAACQDLGVAPPTDEQARHVIGLGLEDALRHAVPDLSPQDYPRMADRYRHHYLASDHELTLFEGAREMIAWLAGEGVLLAVATGKSRKGLNRAMGHAGFGQAFHASRCADECFSKPHPAMLEELMDELGVVRERVVMIGDTTHDLLMARNAGVAAVAVSYGAHPRAVLEAAGPQACVDTLAALQTWLRQHI